ncbi:hypothetical protein Bca4012_034446 [Brassica carinata]
MSPRLYRSPRSLRYDRRCSLLVYLAILDTSLRNMRMHLSSSLSLLDDSAMNLSASRGVDLSEDEAPPSLFLGVSRLGYFLYVNKRKMVGARDEGSSNKTSTMKTCKTSTLFDLSNGCCLNCLKMDEIESR